MHGSFEDILEVHLASRAPLLFLVSWEEDRVLRHLGDLRERYYPTHFTWSITEGLVRRGETGGETMDEKYKGPLAALEFVGAYQDSGLFVLLDFHPYLGDSRIVRKLRDLVPRLQTSGSAVVIVSPKLVVPVELEKDLVVMDYPLPTLEDARRLYQTVEAGVARNPRFRIELDEDEKEALLQATLGLTENETKNVLAKALVSGSALTASDIDVVLAEKDQIIRKSGILEVYSSPERFDDIGGLDAVKEWLDDRGTAFSAAAREYGLPYPKGLLVIGVPGCGKSLLAKAVAHAWRQPLLKLDVGRVFGSLVGSSEENIRSVVKVAEAVAPAILWIDEIEKGFAGIKSAGDSGTSARVFSTFLTWMQEKTSPVFVIATANDISALPPEMLRKGRFDEIFFVDLPLPEERVEILRLHLARRERDPERGAIDLERLADAATDFSGAELEQAVVSAMFKAFARDSEVSTETVLEAIQETYPLAKTMQEPIVRMREWAQDRARYASRKWRDHEGNVHPVERWAHLGSVSGPSAPK